VAVFTFQKALPCIFKEDQGTSCACFVKFFFFCYSLGCGISASPIEIIIFLYALQILHLRIELHLIFEGGKHLSDRGNLNGGRDPPSRFSEKSLIPSEALGTKPQLKP
jgi:hypothetical protein